MSNTPKLNPYQEMIAPWNDERSGAEVFDTKVTFTLNCEATIKSEAYYTESKTGEPIYNGDAGAEFMEQAFTPFQAFAEYKQTLAKRRNELEQKVKYESSWLSRLNKHTAETLYKFHDANLKAFSRELEKVERKILAVSKWTLELEDWELTD